jgi:hypothetical protein
LYVDRYSSSNPQFTPNFIKLAVAQQLLSVHVLCRADDGTILGVVGHYARAGLLTTPLFGYDTTLPTSLGLYRLLSLKVLHESRRLGLNTHASGGAADFKRQRGATSTVECCSIYVAHLPWWRRLAWSPLCLVFSALRSKHVRGCGPVHEVTSMT